MPETPDSLDSALQTLRIDPERKRKGTRRGRSWVRYGVTGLLVVLAAGAFLLRG
ncbi:MAG: hypothetical protein HYV46_15275, partial [candidate division NC10 bacterium]|nr:hypothetical protein [candidate division NC10 bacterium]